MRIVPTNSTVKSGVWTGKVPGDGGTSFFLARLPAIASIGTIIKNRPISIAAAKRKVVPMGVRAQPGKGRAVVSGG